MKRRLRVRSLHPLACLSALALLAAARPGESEAARPPEVSVALQDYGQTGDDGIDMAAFGKILRLSMSIDGSGQQATLKLRSGRPGSTMMLVFGAGAAAVRLPWGDTFLVSAVAAVVPIVCDADGSAAIVVPLRSFSEHSGESIAVHVQGFATGDDAGLPLVSSNGLRISLTQR